MPDTIRPAAMAMMAALLLGATPAHPAKGDQGDALATAVRAGDLLSAEILLGQHTDPNRKLAFNATPLMWAVDTQNGEMVALLLARGARPNGADIDGMTPLGLACELGDPAIVAMLVKAGADVRTATADGVRPLAICAAHASAASVAALLAAGAQADSSDPQGQTPLMWAASTGDVESMTLLLDAGADVNRASVAGFTPLFFAIKSGVLPATRLLLDAGANVAHLGPEGTNAAQLAIYQKNYAAAVLLIERMAEGSTDLTMRDRNGNQLLHAAAIGGDMPLVTLLLSKGADPNALTGPSRVQYRGEANLGRPPPKIPPMPPLLLAAANGHVEVMQSLLKAGARGDYRTDDGTNVLLAAAQSRSARTLELALTLAPDANVATSIGGGTALHRVLAQEEHADTGAMLGMLAAAGARTDIKNTGGTTARQMANEGADSVKQLFLASFPPTQGGTLAKADTSEPRKN